MKDRIYEIIAKKLSSECTEAENKILSEWISVSSANKKTWEILRATKEEVELKENPQSTSLIFNELSKKLNPETHKFRPWKKVLKYAATLLIIIGLGTLLSNVVDKSKEISSIPNNWKVVSCEIGQIKEVLLSDGSKVWLNNQTTIKYPITFSGEKRTVQLEGEAYFEVAKDVEKPFRVFLSDSSKIEVLGTSFNIQAYSGDNVIETSVLSGKVKFTKDPEKLNKSIVLAKNDKSTFYKSIGTLTKSKITGEEEIAWIDGRLVFSTLSFYDITKILERKFGIPILFDKDSVKHIEITATFDKNDSLEEVLYLLSKTENFSYRHTGNMSEIIIY